MYKKAEGEKQALMHDMKSMANTMNEKAHPSPSPSRLFMPSRISISRLFMPSANYLGEL